MLLEGFYQLIYNTSHLFILAFKQNVTPIKCPVVNSAAHKDREGDRWKMIAVLFLFFFIFQRDGHTIKRDIIRIFGINSSGTD